VFAYANTRRIAPGFSPRAPTRTTAWLPRFPSLAPHSRISGPHTRSASRGSARSPSEESADRLVPASDQDAADDERAHDEIEDLRARLLALDDDKSGLGTFFAADALPGLPTDEELFTKRRRPRDGGLCLRRSRLATSTAESARSNCGQSYERKI
jgi:hypothetical protein